MKYTLRNTVILALLFVVSAVAGGYFIPYRLRNDVIAAENSLAERKKELEKLRTANASYAEVESKLQAVRIKWLSHPKHILNEGEENSVSTFAYFNEIASSENSRIDYTFRYDQNIPTKKGAVFQNIYSLTGEGSFANVYRFFKTLEQNVPLYTVEELNITPVVNETNRESPRLNHIKFEAVVKGYSTALDADKNNAYE